MEKLLDAYIVCQNDTSGKLTGKTFLVAGGRGIMREYILTLSYKKVDAGAVPSAKL